MSYYDLPKIRKRTKPPTALTRMTKETAERKFSEKVYLAEDLKRQLKKCERDITKYYLTMTKKDAE
jgi:hypothetical protein